MKKSAIVIALLLAFAVFPALAGNPNQWSQTTASTSALPLSPPASIAGNGAWATPCIATFQTRAIQMFGALSGAGTLQIQRYAQVIPGTPITCAQPVGPAVPATALVLTQGGGCPSSSYCGNVASNDGQPFMGMIGTLTDTSGSTNTIAGVTLLGGAE